MAMLEVLVQMHELIAAANKMNQAMETYQEAVENAKTAAADLASKWEGTAKDAFVTFQEDAYSWHKAIINVVRQMIEVIRKVADKYDEMENKVKNLMKG